MRASRLTSALGATALALCALASVAAGQERSRQRAPLIRVYSTGGASVVNTTTYVQPQINVSEDAYVFAVETDLDGQIQVLHPEFPGLSVKIMARTQLQLPNFFVGFDRAPYGDVYSSGRFARYSPYSGYNDTRGTVIALASRVPFNLELLESRGDWNVNAIRRLTENRTPLEAMNALADYIGARGEPIGRDFMRFGGGSTNYYAYNDYYFSPCDLYYGYYYSPGLGFARMGVNQRGFTRDGQRARIVGYDPCGVPIFSYGPVVTSPFPGRPPHPRDTTVFPKARFPDHTPRHPVTTAAEGVFPLAPRPGLGQKGDGIIAAPAAPRSEPRVIETYRTQPTAPSAPAGRMPVDRTVPRAEPTPATGAQPVREFRPPPRVESTPVHEYRPPPRVESPPPARMPDRPREYSPPAPVVHERPSTPPPAPPPRTETTTKPTPSRQ